MAAAADHDLDGVPWERWTFTETVEGVSHTWDVASRVGVETVEFGANVPVPFEVTSTHTMRYSLPGACTPGSDNSDLYPTPLMSSPWFVWPSDPDAAAPWRNQEIGVAGQQTTDGTFTTSVTSGCEVTDVRVYQQEGQLTALGSLTDRARCYTPAVWNLRGRVDPPPDHEGGTFAWVSVGGALCPDTAPPEPIANPDAFTVRFYDDRDAQRSSQSFNVIVNDTDPSGGPLRVIAVTQPAQGEVSLSAVDPMTVRFNPEATQVGEVQFSYTVANIAGGSDTATVTVTVETCRDVYNEIKGSLVTGSLSMEMCTNGKDGEVRNATGVRHSPMHAVAPFFSFPIHVNTVPLGEAQGPGDTVRRVTGPTPLDIKTIMVQEFCFDPSKVPVPPAAVAAALERLALGLVKPLLSHLLQEFAAGVLVGAWEDAGLNCGLAGSASWTHTLQPDGTVVITLDVRSHTPTGWEISGALPPAPLSAPASTRLAADNQVGTWQCPLRSNCEWVGIPLGE